MADPTANGVLVDASCHTLWSSLQGIPDEELFASDVTSHAGGEGELDPAFWEPLTSSSLVFPGPDADLDLQDLLQAQDSLFSPDCSPLDFRNPGPTGCHGDGATGSHRSPLEQHSPGLNGILSWEDPLEGVLDPSQGQSGYHPPLDSQTENHFQLDCQLLPPASEVPGGCLSPRCNPDSGAELSSLHCLGNLDPAGELADDIRSSDSGPNATQHQATPMAQDAARSADQQWALSEPSVLRALATSRPKRLKPGWSNSECQTQAAPQGPVAGVGLLDSLGRRTAIPAQDLHGHAGMRTACCHAHGSRDSPMPGCTLQSIQESDDVSMPGKGASRGERGPLLADRLASLLNSITDKHKGIAGVPKHRLPVPGAVDASARDALTGGQKRRGCSTPNVPSSQSWGSLCPQQESALPCKGESSLHSLSSRGRKRGASPRGADVLTLGGILGSTSTSTSTSSGVGPLRSCGIHEAGAGGVDLQRSQWCGTCSGPLSGVPGLHCSTHPLGLSGRDTVPTHSALMLAPTRVTLCEPTSDLELRSSAGRVGALEPCVPRHVAQGRGVPSLGLVGRVGNMEFQRQVHAQLVSLAKSYSLGNLDAARRMVLELRQVASPCGHVLQRLAHYMLGALSTRFEGTHPLPVPRRAGERSFLESARACINQVWGGLMEIAMARMLAQALQDKTHIHIILLTNIATPDWPTLFRTLARQKPIPSIRVTILVPYIGKAELEPLWDQFPDTVGQVESVARLCGVPVQCQLAFAATSAPWSSLVRIDPRESVAVVSWLTLQMLPDEAVLRSNPRDRFLKWLSSLNPVVLVVVEIDHDFNQPFFLPRFEAVLRTTQFVLENFELGVQSYFAREPLHECRSNEGSALEILSAHNLMNCVACDGLERFERAETLRQWRDRLQRLGFCEKRISDEEFEYLSGLLHHPKSSLVNVDGFGSLRWQNNPMLLIGTWKGSAHS